jgi:hypothetical protein
MNKFHKSFLFEGITWKISNHLIKSFSIIGLIKTGNFPLMVTRKKNSCGLIVFRFQKFDPNNDQPDQPECTADKTSHTPGREARNNCCK